MQNSVARLQLEFLLWVSTDPPRSYRQVMEAWRSTCPRISIWEESLMDGLIEIVPEDNGEREQLVILTPAGRQLLSRSAPSRRCSAGVKFSPPQDR
jgi:DNA-binding MarR family transcriptional regulator